MKKSRVGKPIYTYRWCKKGKHFFKATTRKGLKCPYHTEKSRLVDIRKGKYGIEIKQ